MAAMLLHCQCLFHLTKVIPCPVCHARPQAPFGFSKKSPRLRFAWVVFFRKTLHDRTRNCGVVKMKPALVSVKNFINKLKIMYIKIKKGFILSIDKTGKDRGKAKYANAFIGFGVSRRRSSTGIYLQDAINAGLPVNDEIIPDSETVVFVSVASEGIQCMGKP